MMFGLIKAEGYEFYVDTEVIAHMAADYMSPARASHRSLASALHEKLRNVSLQLGVQELLAILRVLGGTCRPILTIQRCWSGSLPSTPSARVSWLTSPSGPTGKHSLRGRSSSWSF